MGHLVGDHGEEQHRKGEQKLASSTGQEKTSRVQERTGRNGRQDTAEGAPGQNGVMPLLPDAVVTPYL